ncbi:hypothetical protein NHX12_029659 [Muraenolepis orangiensis]|uniref:Uncharacterized protein n=1 Tax=Muraenolepis orangiensis TaxID=630683 RepID=A0A9Q0E8Q7_9TELE|nr:hypothetical protein NHX12_029659 [Muraenolepis orangiensis]
MENTETSLYCVLEEPLINGARMDIQDRTTPGLTSMLCTTGAVTLRSIVDVAGTGLNHAVAVASLLGQKSIRQTRNLLRRWTERLTEEEFRILQDYGSGVETPGEGDPFPDLGLPPDLDGYSGPLVDVGSLERLDLHTVKGKVFYKCCVKVMNKCKLDGRADTVWRKKTGGRQQHNTSLAGSL